MDADNNIELHLPTKQNKTQWNEMKEERQESSDGMKFTSFQL